MRRGGGCTAVPLLAACGRGSAGRRSPRAQRALWCGVVGMGMGMGVPTSATLASDEPAASWMGLGGLVAPRPIGARARQAAPCCERSRAPVSGGGGGGGRCSLVRWLCCAAGCWLRGLQASSLGTRPGRGSAMQVSPDTKDAYRGVARRHHPTQWRERVRHVCGLCGFVCLSIGRRTGPTIPVHSIHQRRPRVGLVKCDLQS